MVNYTNIAEDKQSKIKVLKAKKQYEELLDYTNTLPSSKDRYLLKANTLMHLRRWKDACECCDLGNDLEEDS